MEIKTKAYTKEEIEKIIPIYLLEQSISKKLIYVHESKDIYIPIKDKYDFEYYVWQKEPTLFIVTGNPNITTIFKKEAKDKEHLNKLIKTLPETVTIQEILDTCGIIVWYSSAAKRGPRKEKEVELIEITTSPTFTRTGKFVGYAPIKETRMETKKVRRSIKRTYPKDYIHEVSVYHRTPSVWSEIEMLDFFRDLMRIALSSLSDIKHADYLMAENWHGECSSAEINTITDLRERMQDIKLDEITHMPGTANKACYYVAKYVPLPGIALRTDGEWEYYKPPGEIPSVTGNIKTKIYEYVDILKKHKIIK